MNFFLWAEASRERCELTLKQEPFQPFLLLSFLEFAQVQVFLDIGANVGVYSLLSTLADSVETIYSFEPDKTALKALERNILLNGLGSRIIASDHAVSDKKATLQFATYAPMAGVNGVLDSSIHDADLFKDITAVEAISVDDLNCLKGKVLGLKIDVEGHELKVLRGAKQTLLHSPAIVQVEHYIGDDIDQELHELGYFRLFAAGHDHYFTNIKNFSNPLFVNRAVEYAGTLFVESQSGRWPTSGTIKYALTLSSENSNGRVKINAEKDSRFFSDDVEYAFYLLENGKKVDEVWYTPESCVEFPVNEKAGSIEVKGFVRERDFPEKKVAIGLFIKKPIEGYRAESAVGEAFGLPSQYAVIDSQVSSSWFGYSDLDLSPLLQAVADNKTENVIQLGGDFTAMEIAHKLEKGHLGHLSVLCTPDQASFIKKVGQRTDKEFQVFSKRMALLSVSSTDELETTLKLLAKHLHSTTSILLRAQYLADMGVGVSALSYLLANLPEGSRLYTEGLSNASYRQKLIALAVEHDIAVEWLYPSSTIIPSEQLNLLEHRGAKGSLLWDCDGSADHGFGLSFSAKDCADAHSERTLGLDFSLPRSPVEG
jgi:FkbM family methyltransferase